jgi:urease accessory protein
VAVGRVAAAHGVPLDETAFLYLHAFAANMVSAGVRLIPLGQTDGQRALARLMATCHEVAADAVIAGIGEIGGASLRADIASMKHETQYSRMFRS